MSTVQLACPHCSGLFSLDSSFAGQQVACPLCHATVSTPPLPNEHAAVSPYDPRPSSPPSTNEPLHVGCPLCSQVFQVLPEMAGQQVQCPHCQQTVSLPDFSGQHSQPPAAPPGYPPVYAPPEPQPPVTSQPPASTASGNKSATPAASSFSPAKSRYSAGDLLPPGMSSEPAQTPTPTPPPTQPKDETTAKSKAASETKAESKGKYFAYPPGFEPAETGAPAKVAESESSQTAPSPSALERAKTPPPPDSLLPPTDSRRSESSEAAPYPPASSPPESTSTAKPKSRVDSLLPPGAIEESADESLPPAATSETDSLLPPGAEFPAPASSAKVRGKADELLPPGAEESAGDQLQQVPLPGDADSANLGQRNKAADGSILIPTEDGRQIAIREPVKTIEAGGEEKELRHRTPEERAARRLKKNLIIWAFGAILLAITVLILLKMGPM